MKKYAFLLAVLTFLVSGCDTGTKADEEINPDKLYFFYSNGCPHCHDALEYINKKISGFENDNGERGESGRL